MSRKKNTFTDWDDLAKYLTSERHHMICLFVRVSGEYPGIVESMNLYSPDAGESLVLIHDFDSYGLDWMGDLGLQNRYVVPNLDTLRRVCTTQLGVHIGDLRVRYCMPSDLPSVDDGPVKLEEYGAAWRRLQSDFSQGKLLLSQLDLEAQ